jgi:hypothetical protein
LYWFTLWLATLVGLAISLRTNRRLLCDIVTYRLEAAKANHERAASDEAARIAGVALLAEDAYSEDHRMLIAQARKASDGDGGRPRQIWVGDTAVEVEAGDEDDLEIGGRV